MTAAAQDDEIFFAVHPQLASPYYVMDLELIAPATVLAFPAIPLENLPAHFFVVRCRKAKPPAVGSFFAHAERLISCTNQRIRTVRRGCRSPDSLLPENRHRSFPGNSRCGEISG